MGKFNLDEFDVKKPAKVEKKPAKVEKKPAQEPKVEKKQNVGVKVPMMNIRFSPENYDYMRREAAMRGLSVIKFTNWIIDQYRQDPAHVHHNDVYQNEEKW